MNNSGAIILAVFFSSVTCLAQTPRDIAKSAFKSVVLLEMTDQQGQPLSLGSGFFVSDGIIATNAHVVEGASSGTAKLVGETQKRRILGTVAIDRRSDLALLSISENAPPLHLGLEANLVVGDKVYAVGNPLGLEGTFSEGIVSGLRTVGTDSVIQMTAPISPGSSGGPVMDAAGLVVGVAVATFKNGQNLNLAVPIKYVSKLLASLSPKPEIRDFEQVARTARPTDSIVDEVGARAESGITASSFKFNNMDLTIPTAGFEFRLTNKLPSAVSHVRVRVIYYDRTKAVTDFEDVSYDQIIPPGLTKTVTSKPRQWSGENEAGRAAKYYFNHKEDGTDTNPWESPMTPKVELRILGFDSDDSQ